MDSYSEYSLDEDSLEYDSDIEEAIYEPEELSPTKYNIVLCEIYNDLIYNSININSINNNSINNNSINNNNLLHLNTNYIVMYRFKKYNDFLIDDLICDYLFDLNRWPIGRPINHPIICNYTNICLKIKPEIAECIYLDTGECICILKTFWLRLIQRTWRKIFKKRCNMFQIRHTLKSIRYREIHGKWPIECANMPTIHGMLSYLR
jgi:hypothetical protein